MSTQKDALEFEKSRAAFVALAYRMTGSVSDSEDIVQEAYLRWEGREVEVGDPKAYCSKIVTRLCLDYLKSARVRRESYVGPWLPEPVLKDTLQDWDGGLARAEDVSMALMLALERLTPLERAAFLLHDVFDFDYDEIASTLERDNAACRQLASRARKHLKAQRPRYTASEDECLRVLAAFAQAVGEGNLEALQITLADDARMYTDGGGEVSAATKPVLGAESIARFILGIHKKFPLPPTATVKTALVNGSPGFLVVDGGHVTHTFAIEVEDGKISRLYSMRNPKKLKHLLGAVSN